MGIVGQIFNRRWQARFFVTMLLLAFFGVASNDSAWAGTRSAPGGSTIDEDVIASGGGRMSSGSSTIIGTVGQVAVGGSQASSGATLQHGLPKPLQSAGGGALSVVILGDSLVIVDPGSPHSFEAGVFDAVGTVSYQWFKDDTAKAFDVIPGANDATLDLGSVEESDAGLYQVEASDDVTTAVSQPVELRVSAGLPVAGVFGLALLSGAGLLGAPWLMRRRRRR